MSFTVDKAGSCNGNFFWLLIALPFRPSGLVFKGKKNFEGGFYDLNETGGGLILVSLFIIFSWLAERNLSIFWVPSCVEVCV